MQISSQIRFAMILPLYVLPIALEGSWGYISNPFSDPFKERQSVQLDS